MNETGEKQTGRISPVMAQVFFGIAHAQPTDNLPVRQPSQPMTEFQWSTDQAVLQEYITEVKQIVAHIPQDRRALAPGNMPLDREGMIAWQNDLDRRVQTFVNPWNRKYETEKSDVPTYNPLGLIMPEGLKNIDEWLREQSREHMYAATYRRIEAREKGGFGVSTRESEKMEDDFIFLVHSWNEYHVRFLEALNIQDAGARKNRIDAVGKEIFGKAMGFLSTVELKSLSPYDNPEQWMIYNALNVVISGDRRILPVARLRAIEVLTQYDQAALEKIFYGTDQSTNLRKRYRPSWGWEKEFDETLLRLPRTFWSTDAERTSLKHDKWLENRFMRQILGVAEHESFFWKSDFDWSAVYNRLVQHYPNEAVQVVLLFMTERKIATQAFQGLIGLSKLDPVTALSVFGPKATYLRIHDMPGSTADQINEGMGLEVFDTDFAAEFKDLPKEQLLQVIRRLQLENFEYQRKLFEGTRKDASQYFRQTTAQEVSRIDPNGYWRLLGVNPDTDPNDLEEIIKRNYWFLAKKYHPEGTEPDEDKMKQLNDAHEVLLDPEKRRRYGSR
jgi:hypothetical protein